MHIIVHAVIHNAAQNSSLLIIVHCANAVWRLCWICKPCFRDVYRTLDVAVNDVLVVQVAESFQHLSCITPCQRLRQSTELFDLILYWTLQHQYQTVAEWRCMYVWHVLLNAKDTFDNRNQIQIPSEPRFRFTWKIEYNSDVTWRQCRLLCCFRSYFAHFNSYLFVHNQVAVCLQQLLLQMFFVNHQFIIISTHRRHHVASEVEFQQELPNLIH